MTSTCILGVDVRKLSYRQESCPVILFKVNEGSKVCLHRASVVWSSHLFKDGRHLRVTVWCRGNSRTMTRTLRWKVNLYQTQLNWEGHGVKLPRLGWLRLAREYRWWPWLAHNAPFSWAGQRWLRWSHNCHFFSRLRLVVQWRNLSRGLSIDESVQTRIAGLHRAYVWLPLSPSIRHSLWHKPQCLFRGSANSISGRRGPWFYRCRNVLPEGHCGVDWWSLFEWLQVRTVVPDDTVPRRVLRTHSGLPPWSFELPRLTLAAPLAATSFHQCWPYKGPRWLARFGYCPRIVEAGVERRFHRWGLGGVAIARLRCWGLRGWHWSTRTAVYEGSECFQFVTRLLRLDSSEGSEITRLQLRLPCPDDNRFESGNERALEPSGLVWSSNSSCLWTDGGCCGR